ncbi:MAG: hypothetical protein M1825_001584 [Sarcosagium campestre]|nr:MAG: hypothetical protein M1825_001584 [Sarcosagium campestre]
MSHFFQKLRQSYNRFSPPVLILTATETDAICATRILAAVLKSDFITHNIHPISGYEDLEKTATKVVGPMKRGGGGVIICLGVGGQRDLAKVLDIEDDDTIEVWVMDSRRPYNLKNIYGGGGRVHKPSLKPRGGVIVFDNGDIDAEMADEEASYALSTMNTNRDEGDDSDSSEAPSEASDDNDDDDNENDDRDTRSQSRSRKRKSRSDDDDESSQGSRKKRRSNSSTPIPTKLDPVDIIRNYEERGCSYSEPISSLMYSIASEAGLENNDLLWLALIGLRSRHRFGKSHTDGSQWEATLENAFRSEAMRLNPNAKPHTIDIAAIRYCSTEEYPLLRHGSIYDTLIQSSNLTRKLGLLTKNGVNRLHAYLAKMGCSLRQAKQDHLFVDPTVRKDVLRKLSNEHCDFQRLWTYKTSLSAMDNASIVGALLRVGPEDVKDRFWKAYDASASINDLIEALPSVKGYERTVARTGTAVVKDRIKAFRRFRVAVLGGGAEIGPFSRPAALTDLAAWIDVATGDSRGRPLVLAALDERRGVYVVAGTSTGPRNRFGTLFREFEANAVEAAEARTRADVRPRVDGFDHAVIELPKEGLPAFLEHLSMEM